MNGAARIRKIPPPAEDEPSVEKKSRPSCGQQAPLQFFSRSKTDTKMMGGTQDWARYLSNFARLPASSQYPTVEAAFGFAKYGVAEEIDPESKNAKVPDFSAMTDGLQAKRAHGRKGMKEHGFVLKSNKLAQWNQVRVAEMRRILEERWSSDSKFRAILRDVLKSGRGLLHFERSGKKSFWGGCISKKTGEVVGKNTLGLLMLAIAREHE
jgi:predicted NAD-dependent protein-ADP-ribosyltransferase YbiA (DUF1768 family)